MLWILFVLAGILVFAIVFSEEEEERKARAPVRLLPGECMNLRLLPEGDGLSLAPAVRNHQWFAATFQHLPTREPMTLTLCMEGNDIGINKSDCAKWTGLHPLLTYADPRRFETYEWFTRDKYGRWVSSDLGKTGEARLAGNGPLPEQAVLPPGLAEACLHEDGAYWSPWQTLTDTTACCERKCFTIRHHFARASASLAMHVPYSYSYHLAALQRLQAAHYPGVFVDEIGCTREGRKLQVIRIDDPSSPLPLRIAPGTGRLDCAVTPHISLATRGKGAARRVMVVVAREHATEHTASWMLQGMVRELVSDTARARRLREGTVWLIVPLYDPDGAVHSRFNPLTNHFFEHEKEGDGATTPQEVISYAKYLRAFVNAGYPVETITAMYGLECSEGAPILSPFVMACDRDLLIAFNDYWFARLRKKGVRTGSEQPWGVGWAPYRLHQWVAYRYGALALTFEINDRYPPQRLHRAGVEALGREYLTTLLDFMETDPGAARIRQLRQFLRDREKEMALWYKAKMTGSIDDPTLYDLLMVGY